MMNDEDDRPKKKIVHDVGCDLSTVSVDELVARIGLLREEIVRIEQEVARKTSSRAAAEDFFKR